MNIRKLAFTLAEVLIVVGIIGLIAEMTIPSLLNDIAKQDKTVRLKKIYSSMQQAIMLSEIDNGSSMYWDYVRGGSNIDSLIFFNTYFAPYLSFIEIDNNSLRPGDSDPKTKIFFNDGSSMQISMGSCVDFIFDTNGKKNPNSYGYDKFTFLFCTGADSAFWFHRNDKTFGVYLEGQTRADALTWCNNVNYVCSALLQIDNWDFKDDYPWK